MQHCLAIKPSPFAFASRIAHCASQEPLVDTRLTHASLRASRPGAPPQAAFLGIGLCSRDVLSRAVPLDLLGLLLPAEAIRRAAGARELLVLVADRHALDNGFSPAAVEARARAVEAVLENLRERCGLDSMSVVRASDFHGDPDYLAVLETVRQRVRPHLRRQSYVLRQLADLLYLDRRRGKLLKIGWALRGADDVRRCDELAFDRALCSVGGDDIGFVYCKPGRALSDEAPRVSPYVVRRPEARLCLDLRDDPSTNLARAATVSRPTAEAYRRHLKALVYTYGRHVEPLPRGRLEARLEALLVRLCAGTADPRQAA